MIKKICDRCGKVLNQNEKCKCSLINRKKIYDGVEWKKIRGLVKERAKGLDEYKLKYEREIKKGKIAHHIYTVEEKPELRYDISNLVYVSTKTHNEIHSEYDKGRESKERIQENLMKIRRGDKEKVL